MAIPVSWDIQPQERGIQARLTGFSVTFSSYPASFGSASQA